MQDEELVQVVDRLLPMLSRLIAESNPTILAGWVSSLDASNAKMFAEVLTASLVVSRRHKEEVIALLREVAKVSDALEALKKPTLH